MGTRSQPGAKRLRAWHRRYNLRSSDRDGLLMKHQPSDAAEMQTSDNEDSRSRPRVESTNSTPLNFRGYLRQKRLHLRYLIGKLVFRLRYWSCEIVKPSFYIRRLNEVMLKFHGTGLGILRQYNPRPVRSSPLPTSSRQVTALPTIAIVTPSYNQSDLIRYTVESVLRQNYPYLQYAVVDGGSTDGTAEIMAKYQDRLAYYVSEGDKGQSDAIAKGFSNLSGDIMAYLNSDDLLMPGALRFVGGFFAAHPDIDVIYGHRIIVDETGQEVGRWILPRHDPEAIRHFDFVPQETLFWRRALYDKVGGISPSFQFAMDWDLLLRFIAAGARFSRVPHFLACFRVHNRQKTHALLDTLGEREKARLIEREYPTGGSPQRVQQLQDSYQMRSSLCATLLKCGIRY
jgi:GT2 family glycosyltransferase